MARNYGSGPKWESAVVVERKGPLSYTVQLDSGVIWRRHIDQLRDGVSVTSQDEDDVPVGNSTPLESETPDQESPDRPGTANTEPAGMNNPTETLNNSGASGNGQNAARVEPEPEKRYPSRVCHQPQRVHVTVETELNLTVNNSDLFFWFIFVQLPILVGRNCGVVTDMEFCIGYHCMMSLLCHVFYWPQCACAL